MNARFYAPDAHEIGAEIDLPGDEAQHLSRVLRLKAGDSLAVFNGSGGEFAAVVASATKTRVRVRLGDRIAAKVELPMALTLAQAVLKGDRMDAVVRDAVMLGFVAVQPIVTTRSEVSLSALTRGDRHERWHRIAVSSAKQCGRAVVPVVAPPIAFDGPASLAHLPSPQFLLVEPGASTASVTVAGVGAAPPAAATLVVGPEGGWTAAEVEQCAHHAHALTLGSLTLRADAAAVVAATALLTQWKLI
ncbi:MAG TPA: RsmE family RNA methyltransferase [Vicinamibacterales bacterium]|nr:RsmE family RNA methyltransferase [Vicinamibacterales bacterium]